MFASNQRQGEFFVVVQAILWGLFPVITILSYSVLSPLVSLGASTFFSALFFVVFLSVRRKWHELKNTAALRDILWTTFFIGILFYVFFFFGLKYTSAGNASIISLMETLFSYLFFQIWRKERILRAHLLGSCFMLVGAVIILSPNFSGIHVGDILILLAAFVAPFGNFFQQRARRLVSSETIMCIRSLLVFPVVFVMARMLGEQFSLPELRSSLWFLVINGVVLLGFSRIFWIEGIHRVNVTKANALSSVSPVFTLLFVWLFFGTTPTVLQLFSLLPMLVGMILLGVEEK